MLYNQKLQTLAVYRARLISMLSKIISRRKCFLLGISKDRARFARAWFREFNEWGDRGGETEEEAFDAWFNMVKIRYKKHILRSK